MATTNKTQPTDANVAEHIAAIENEQRRADCLALVKLFRKVTGQKPVMWGPNLIGFGSYRYKYDSGREGEFCATGFASRKNDLSIYLMAGFAGKDELLAALGKHKTGKACLYIKRLDAIDTKALEQLIASSYAEIKRRYPEPA